jgi:opacity protein-like surface antigen
MKKALFVASLISTAISVNAIAQQDSSRFYAGVGFGKVTVPDAEGINFSDANNGFIQLGYKINENFAIEGQYSKSTKDASASYFVEGMDVSEEWWDSIVSLNPGVTLTDAQSWYPYVEADIGLGFDATIETTAIYGVYRSVGDLYLKAKAGYLREKSTLTIRANSYSLTDVSEKATESESGFSGGLGVGYKFTKNLFSELEYTMLNDDLDFYSLSINYQF